MIPISPRIFDPFTSLLKDALPALDVEFVETMDRCLSGVYAILPQGGTVRKESSERGAREAARSWWCGTLTLVWLHILLGAAGYSL